MDKLKFLVEIKRFPSVNIWKKNDQYYAECSPSFDEIEGVGETLEEAIDSLIFKLEYYGYFNSEEIIKLKKLKETVRNG